MELTKEIPCSKTDWSNLEENEAQPEFSEDIKTKIESCLGRGLKSKPEQIKRLHLLQNSFHLFKSATIGGPPMYGAQQIPGDDSNLRVGDVCFPYKSYARSEIVFKASSALTTANQIID